MEFNIEIEKIVTLCKKCGNSSDFHKFRGKTCIKCCSKVNNERLKEKNYQKQYYEINKDTMLENVAKYYIEVRKPLKPKALNPVGRPKKIKS